MSKPYEVLEAAAKWLEDHDWGRGIFFAWREGVYDPDDSFRDNFQKEQPIKCCALGACMVSVPLDEAMAFYYGGLSTDKSGVLVKIQDEHYLRYGMGLAAYNDTVAQTKEDVIERMRELATKLREEDANVAH